MQPNIFFWEGGGNYLLLYPLCLIGKRPVKYQKNINMDNSEMPRQPTRLHYNSVTQKRKNFLPNTGQNIYRYIIWSSICLTGSILNETVKIVSKSVTKTRHPIGSNFWSEVTSTTKQVNKTWPRRNLPGNRLPHQNVKSTQTEPAGRVPEANCIH